jgi:tetratricopeptide (TPR) repeat protein
VPFRIFWRVSLCLVTSALATIPPVHAAPPQFEEPLKLFQPRQPATERERDFAQALAFYGMAREAEARGDFAKALRWYHRALRYDPSCLPAARSALRLAIQVQRPDQAVEAAQRISKCEDEDRLPLRYVALYLTRQGRWEEAINLYERTLGLSPQVPTSDEDVVMMMEMARLCHLIKDNEKAATYFKEVLKALEEPRRHNISPKVRRDLLGENGTTYQLIGSCLLLAGDLEVAKAAFKKAEQDASSDAWASFNAASIHRHSGRLEEALKELDVTLRSQRRVKGLGPFLLLEEILNDLGRGSELIDYLASLRETQLEDTTLGYFLAQKLFEAGQFDRAEHIYRSVIDQSPTSTAYQHLLEIHLSRSEFEEAADILATVVEKAGSLDSLGDRLDRIAGTPDTVNAILSLAEKSATADIQPSPSHTLAAGLVALAAERFDRANGLMARAIALHPDRAENLLLIWGLDLLSADRTEEAIRVLRDGTERKGVSDEQRSIFYYYLAAALELNNQTDAALEAANEAVRLSEDSAPFHVRIAWVLYHGGRKQESAKAYRAVIDRFDDDHKSDQSRNAVRQARMVLSTLCLAEGRVDEAVEWLEQVLDDYPQDAGALNDLGYLWADENENLERALGMIQRAVEAEPENAAYRDSLGWVLYRRGEYQAAVAELAKAAEMEPDPVVLDHLGDAYAKTSQAAEAKKAWERALERFEETGMEIEAVEVRKKLGREK